LFVKKKKKKYDDKRLRKVIGKLLLFLCVIHLDWVIGPLVLLII